MTIDNLINAMVSQMKANETVRTAVHPDEIRQHAGKFTWAELQKVSFVAPSIFISCLGWKQATDQERRDFDTHQDLIVRARFIAGVVTKDPKSANDRNNEARLISQYLSLYLASNDWGFSDVSTAQDIRAEAFFVPTAEAEGQSLWAVSWYHVLGVDPVEAAGDIQDFLVAHGEKYHAGDSENPAAIDHIELPALDTQGE